MAHQPVKFSFQNCSYTVTVKEDGGTLPHPALAAAFATKQKVLLTDVSADCSGGQVLAIMGPSGAGKTTLLRMLTLEKVGGTPSGVIRLNGLPFTPTLYAHHCAYVEQEDTNWTFLSCREHVAFAVQLYQARVGAAAAAEAVQHLLTDLGLESCQDTRAGNALVKGLSGGQKRRLSLAIALAKKPAVVFLDEPTSGLDAAAAAAVMRLLVQVAEKTRAAICCTIHQPSSGVFSGFDTTLVLSGGRTAFFGKASEMARYLQSIGRTVPAATNPADHMLDIINKDFASAQQVDDVLDRWAAAHPTGALEAAEDPMELPATETAGFASQLAVLLAKHGKLLFKDPLAYIAKVGVGMGMAVFFCLLFIYSRKKAQEYVLQHVFAGVFLINSAVLLPIATVFTGHFEFKTAKREIVDGMYGIGPYVIANTLYQVPMTLLVGFATILPLYLMLDWDFVGFPMVCVVASLYILSFEAAAQLFSLDANVILGIANFQNLWFTGFVFSGMFVQAENVVWPFKIFSYALPTPYGSRSFMYEALKEFPLFSGVEDCTPSGADCPRGFVCPGVPDVSCFGDTGKRILDSIGTIYGCFSSEDRTAQDIGYLLIIYAVFKVLYVATLGYRCAERETPGTPLPAGSSPSEASELPASTKNKSGEMSVEMRTGPAPGANGSCLAPEMVFSFAQCSYEVKVAADGSMLLSQGLAALVQTKPKLLLDNVSASVCSGEVLAIMGPGGAGKTTLLKMLALEDVGGRPSGTVLLNGQPFTSALYMQYCASSEQDFALWAHLTCREHVEFAVDLCQSGTAAAARGQAVDTLIRDLGLQSCQHTKAGNMLMKGLSGGQKRRLSLAIALAKRPALMFMDEPTSGLDAAGAAAVMNLLKALALQARAGICCTIHQPSSGVFSGFDKTLVLSGGRTAYFGEASEMAAFLGRAGRAVPPATNPADHMLDVVNKDFASSEQVDEVLEFWGSTGTVETPAGADVSSLTPFKKPSIMTQTSTLVMKHFTLALRDPLMYGVRVGLFLVISVFFCIVYIDTRKENQELLINRLFLQWWLSNIAPALGILPLVAQYFETPALKREMRDGAYNSVVYVLATSCLQLPIMFLFALCVLLPPYIMANWPWGSIGPNVLVMAMCLWSFECLAQFNSMEAHPVLGLMQFINMWFVGLLMNGFMIPEEDIIWPFRALTFALPLRWTVEGTSYALWSRSTYSGVEPCDPSPDGLFCQRGFQCPGLPQTSCYGANGTQILDSFNANYKVFRSDDRVLECILKILGFALVFKLFYTLRLSTLLGVKTLKPPSS